MAGIGDRIISFYGFGQKFEYIKELYITYDAWAIGIAGFTPIPYKVFTISAGAFNINFWVFIIASMVSRSARFFLVGGLIYLFGPEIQSFIDKYFNILVVVFTILLVAGFIVIKYFF
jgi:membrane protein YqaA with SNARE-associated domain